MGRVLTSTGTLIWLALALPLLTFLAVQFQIGCESGCPPGARDRRRSPVAARDRLAGGHRRVRRSVVAALEGVGGIEAQALVSRQPSIVRVVGL
jgi:hypothetical protein